MFLDTYQLSSLVAQVQYRNVYLLWDHAGAIADALTNIWDGVELVEGQPQRQILRSEDVQIETGLKTSTITLNRPASIDQFVGKLKQTFDVWGKGMELDEASRVSSRAVYVKNFDSLGAANKELLELGLVPWPSGKVFDQPENGEKNSFDLTYRFEDDKSFSTLRIHTEKVALELKLNREFDPEDKIQRTRTAHRIVVDFDRGVLGKVSYRDFRVEDWFKGFQHLLRRDIDKVFGKRK